MLTGREQETAFLENHYKRPGSQILVVYGQRGVGKTALLTAFAEKKQTIRLPETNGLFAPNTDHPIYRSQLLFQGNVLSVGTGA